MAQTVHDMRRMSVNPASPIKSYRMNSISVPNTRFSKSSEQLAHRNELFFVDSVKRSVSIQISLKFINKIKKLEKVQSANHESVFKLLTMI